MIGQVTKAYFTSDFSKWVLQWPGQAMMCARCINWTAQAEEALRGKALDAFQTKCDLQLQEIVGLVRGGLSPRAQKTLQALICVDAHNRDVVERLRQHFDLIGGGNGEDCQDFAWTSNLRYYLPDFEDGTINVEMVSTSLKYAFDDRKVRVAKMISI
jgi:dynein heavy chain